MSHDTAFSMNELELESAELLPARETLCVPRCHPASHGGSSTSTVVQQSNTGYGNTAQVGLINISAGNGDLNNLFSLGSGSVW